MINLICYGQEIFSYTGKGEEKQKKRDRGEDEGEMKKEKIETVTLLQQLI